MRQFLKRIQGFLADEGGPTAVEYAVMLAFIVIVSLIAIQTFGTKTSASFNHISTKLPQ